MTLDQKIQVWNTVGTWLAGIAIFAAVVVSLHLARRGERIKLKVLAGRKLVVHGDGTAPGEHLDISVTNLSDHTVVVNTVGWAVGKRKQRWYCIQPMSGPWTAQYPIALEYGKQASFRVSFVHTPTWLAEFANGFLRSLSNRKLDTLVAPIHTSVGQTIQVTPEKELLDRLRKVRKVG